MQNNVYIASCYSWFSVIPNGIKCESHGSHVGVHIIAIEANKRPFVNGTPTWLC
jgi:hypothetical protein